MNSINDVSIIMTGASPETRHTAALLISHALQDHGFASIDVLDSQGREIELPDYIPTVLQMIRQRTPDLFHTKVVVQEVKTVGYPSEEPEKEDDTDDD